MSYQLIAQTEAKQHLGDSYQLFVYQDLSGEPGALETLELISDYNLKRGSASTKDKLEYIKNTSIEFMINDAARFLINTMKDKPDTDFKGILKKNGSDFFIGYLSLYLSKFDFTKTDTQVKLTLYDGLNRLKEFEDITSIGTGLLRVKDIIRAVFNKLNFNINIHLYTKFYIGSYSGVLPTYTMHQKIEDLISTYSGKLNYYELLLILCKQYQWTVYQENAVWVLRQNTSLEHTTNTLVDGAFKEVNTYNSAGQTSMSRVNQDVSVTRSELKENPLKFFYDRIRKATMKISCYEPGQAPQLINNTEQLAWVNPFFKEGSNGWTVVSGTVNFRDDSCFISNGASVYQESGEVLSGEQFQVKLSVTSIRMVLDNADRITDTANNPLFRIAFVGETNTYYWDRILNEWRTDLQGSSLYGQTMYGITVESDYIEEYNKNTLTIDLELTAPAENGVVKIFLYGGATASGNNYPYEFMAQHHYCLVQKKFVDLATIVSPKQLNANAAIDDLGDEINIDVPYLEFNPYSGVTIWTSTYDEIDGEVFSKANKWTYPGGTEILSLALVERIVKYNRKNSGYDLRFAPGKVIGFTNVFAMDLESTSTTNYFIPVYEETALISDHKRFIVMQNEASSETIDKYTEFIFDDKI